MNSEIRLQKSPLAAVRRAVLVMVVLAAWAVVIVGIVRDRQTDSASNESPRIEKKAPEKPYYKFLEQVPV
jgi:hypothetical protein